MGPTLTVDVVREKVGNTEALDFVVDRWVTPTRGEGGREGPVPARLPVHRRDGGSSNPPRPKSRPSFRPSRPSSPPLSIPVTDRKPGRVARSLTSVALPAAVSLHGGLPAALVRRARTTLRPRRRPGRRCTTCWTRTPPSCQARPSRHSLVRLSPLLFASPLPSFLPSPSLPFLLPSCLASSLPPSLPPSLSTVSLSVGRSSLLFSFSSVQCSAVPPVVLPATAHCRSAFLLTRFDSRLDFQNSHRFGNSQVSHFYRCTKKRELTLSSRDTDRPGRAGRGRAGRTVREVAQ